MFFTSDLSYTSQLCSDVETLITLNWQTRETVLVLTASMVVVVVVQCST
jgi:hypothetical protein